MSMGLGSGLSKLLGTLDVGLKVGKGLTVFDDPNGSLDGFLWVGAKTQEVVAQSRVQDDSIINVALFTGQSSDPSVQE